MKPAPTPDRPPLAALLGLVEPWHADATCAGTDPDLWFPTRGEETAEAKQICAGCPVREPCLEYALRKNEQWGIWGGMSRRERDRVRRDRARTTAEAGERRAS